MVVSVVGCKLGRPAVQSEREQRTTILTSTARRAVQAWSTAAAIRGRVRSGTRVRTAQRTPITWPDGNNFPEFAAGTDANNKSYTITANSNHVFAGMGLQTTAAAMVPGNPSPLQAPRGRVDALRQHTSRSPRNLRRRHERSKPCDHGHDRRRRDDSIGLARPVKRRGREASISMAITRLPAASTSIRLRA